MKGNTVVIGMSGGVDSSVAALLLKEQGYNVVGLFMHNWEEKDEEGVCTATADYEDVARVCDVIGIPYYSVNFAKNYYDNVFTYFLEEYAAGRTPNPDVLCNREIKFGVFSDHAKKLGADFVATGHYCALEEYGGKLRLARAFDDTKEQSYFLNQVPVEKLQNVLFPLAHLPKSEIRAIAERNGLVTAKKKDSTGICFIGERNFRRFLSQYLPARPGRIVDLDGREVGEHIGLMYYTLGQRKGLGIGGDKLTDGGRWFVVEKRLDSNTLVVSCGDESPLYHKSLVTQGFNEITPFPANRFRAYAQVRYRERPKPVTVMREGENVRLVFDEAERAITPGQFAVLYTGEGYRSLCYGGGVIQRIDD